MLLNNNGPSDTTAIQPSGGNVVFRRQKQESTGGPNNGGSGKKKGKSGGGAGGGTSSVRNSWSFTSELPIQHHVLPIAPIKENIYVDPETLINGNGGDLKAVSRSRLRQRSVSNLNAAALAGTRSRDHSSSNRHQNGTMAKGVDYIRVHINPTVRAPAPLSVHQQPAEMTTILPTEDRSEYGNPDGSSAHSTAERDSGVVGSAKTVEGSSCLIHPGMDLYQAINQNQSNDYKLIQGYAMQPETTDPNSNRVESQQPSHPAQPMVRHGSGRGSATNTRAAAIGGGGFPSSSSSAGSTGKTSAEVHASRKPAAAGAPPLPISTGPNAVKTEWTFLPSPTATEPQQLHHREINSKPEVCVLTPLAAAYTLRQPIKTPKMGWAWRTRWFRRNLYYLYTFMRRAWNVPMAPKLDKRNCIWVAIPDYQFSCSLLPTERNFFIEGKNGGWKKLARWHVPIRFPPPVIKITKQMNSTEKTDMVSRFFLFPSSPLSSHTVLKGRDEARWWFLAHGPAPFVIFVQRLVSQSIIALAAGLVRLGSLSNARWMY